MDKLVVGGVPEHFNLPWHLALENGFFSKEKIHFEWRDFYGGTGAMTKALRENEVDACVLLSEGIIADIINGNQSKIIQLYINTPLIWGVHTAYHNPIKYYSEIYDKKYAISRFGSGSHLMAMVDASRVNKNITDEQWEVVNNLSGAVESLKNLESSVFYWEKYTTKPYVEKQIMKSLGEFISPWPCFMIAATEKAIKEKPEAIKKMLDIINFTSGQFMSSINPIELISKRYNLNLEDTESWFYSTQWCMDNSIHQKTLISIIHNLKKLKVINQEDIKLEDLVWNVSLL